jgi:hypothetical protein
MSFLDEGIFDRWLQHIAEMPIASSLPASPNEGDIGHIEEGWFVWDGKYWRLMATGPDER